MKELTLLFISLVSCSSAYLIKVPTTNTQIETRIAPLGWVHIQKLLLPLFDNVCEDSTNAAVVQMANDFTLDISNGNYMKADIIENLRSLKTGKGLLPKGEIFTEYNINHMNELKALYEVFFYAKDFDTFYRAASWARQNVNCGLFVDAIYLAIVNRKDTAKISVPAPYELLPNYFIKKDAVIRASFLLTADEVTPTPEAGVRVEGNSYVLDSNYTTEVDDNDEDAKLAYFREDIGLNSYYFIRKLRNAPWFNTPNVVNNLYGERMFQMMRQFAARYDLERYSHELPELEAFNWDSVVAYDPMLIYSNGNDFGHRITSGYLSDSDDVAFLKTIENNLATVVSHLKQAGHNKPQILSHLMEILVTSDKSYETLCRKLLGFEKDSTEMYYSILEHFMTTLRDPLFWRINKKMVQLISNALKVLPSYSRSELYFPGVEVLNVETKKMMTSFDNFQFDVTDSLKTSTANTTFQVKIAQPRLNHKPFIMKLNISSLVTKKGLVKIYIGPKMMPGELALKKHLFVLLDLFEVSLKRGYNVISRSSEEMTSFSGDFISLRALRKKVEDAEFGLDSLPLTNIESQIGYPSRLILPRGLPGGLPLQVFVFVAPLTKGTLGGSTSMANMEINTAILSPGYPLDLPIEIRQLFGLPNSLVKEFIVTHKDETAKPGNGARPGFGGRPGTGGRPGPSNFDQTYDTSQTDFTENRDHFDDTTFDNDLEDDIYDDSLSVRGLLGERPNFTFKKTDSKNYGNKNQYGHKEDYAAKRTDKTPTPPFVDNTVKENEFFNVISSSVTNDNNEDTLSVHQLLGARPDFTIKRKDATDYTAKRTQFKKKEDFISKKTDKTYDTSRDDINNKEIFNTVSLENIVEDDILYVDTLIPHGLLGDKVDYTKENNDNIKVDSKEKKYQYIKKEEERAVKREQKKEKYTAKGEQKKEENITKKDQKLEDNIAKRDKHLADLRKKGINKKFDDKYLDKPHDELFDSLQETYTTTYDDKFNVVSYEDLQDNIISHSDTFIPHDLLGSKPDAMRKKDTSPYKTYQYKKTKEEYDPTRTQYKKVNYREKIVDKKDIKSNDSLKNKVDHGVMEEMYTKKYIVVDDNKVLHENNIGNDFDVLNAKEAIFSNKMNKTSEENSIGLQKNVNYDEGNGADLTSERVYSNEDTTKTADVISDDSSVTSKPVTKVFESKKIYKNINDDKLNKNVVVDKGTITKKDITKTIPAVHRDKTVTSISDEETVEFEEFTIYEPIITTELPKPKKRVTVYDFLFNPTDYSDEDLKVYE